MAGSLRSPSKDIEVREAVGADVFALAPILRPEDVKEIKDLTGQDPVTALGEGFVNSTRCFTILYKGEPAAMMGVVPSATTDPKLGYVWLLGSNRAQMFSFSMVKWARAWLLELCDGYDVVGNLVSAENMTHVRFLKHVGANFIMGHPDCGPGRVMALEFVFTSESLKETPPSV